MRGGTKPRKLLREMVTAAGVAVLIACTSVCDHQRVRIRLKLCASPMNHLSSRQPWRWLDLLVASTSPSRCGVLRCSSPDGCCVDPWPTSGVRRGPMIDHPGTGCGAKGCNAICKLC